MSESEATAKSFLRARKVHLPFIRRKIPLEEFLKFPHFKPRDLTFYLKKHLKIKIILKKLLQTQFASKKMAPEKQQQFKLPY